MPKVTPPEPQSAADYDDRSTAAVKAVLIEIGQKFWEASKGSSPSLAAPSPGCCWAMRICRMSVRSMWILVLMRRRWATENMPR